MTQHINLDISNDHKLSFNKSTMPTVKEVELSDKIIAETKGKRHLLLYIISGTLIETLIICICIVQSNIKKLSYLSSATYCDIFGDYLTFVEAVDLTPEHFKITPWAKAFIILNLSCLTRISISMISFNMSGSQIHFYESC